jgi:hypothetical protein
MLTSDNDPTPNSTRRKRLGEFHEAHGGVMQASILRHGYLQDMCQAAGEGVLSDADLLIANILLDWIEKAQCRNEADCFPCLGCCGTGFYGHKKKPDAFLILTPFAAPTTHALVLGICRRCADRNDDAALRSVVLKTLRKWMYPDLTIAAEPGTA